MLVAAGELNLDDLSINASYAVRGLTGDLLKSKVPSTLDGSCKKYAGWNVERRRQEKFLEAMGGGPATPLGDVGGGMEEGAASALAPTSTTSQGSQKSQDSQGSHGSRGSRKRVRKEKKEEDGVTEAELKKFIENTKMPAKKPRKGSAGSGKESKEGKEGKESAAEGAPQPQSLP